MDPRWLVLLFLGFLERHLGGGRDLSHASSIVKEVFCASCVYFQWNERCFSCIVLWMRRRNNSGTRRFSSAIKCRRGFHSMQRYKTKGREKKTIVITDRRLIYIKLHQRHMYTTLCIYTGLRVEYVVNKNRCISKKNRCYDRDCNCKLDDDLWRCSTVRVYSTTSHHFAPWSHTWHGIFSHVIGNMAYMTWYCTQ